MRVYKTLANLDFAGKLYEASLQTQTGKQFIGRYQAYCISNPVTCKIVNQFVQEAKNYLYDSGVASVYESIASVIADNKYSWAIASACERINEDNSKGNYLSRRAVEQVAPILEMDERGVVDYIKSGAFKSVMYVEAFRNIARSIYRDQPVVENKTNYSVTHPISVVEKTEKGIFFEVLGSIYKIVDSEIMEAEVNEVSNDFIYMCRLLESNNISLDNDKLVLNLGNRTYMVEKQGECIIKANDRDISLTVDQLRENSVSYLTTIPYSRSNNTASILESFAKIVENYNSVAILNNVSVVSTSNDKFMVIEHQGNAYAKMISTNHTSPWKVKDNIAKVCESVKKYTHVDLKENYSESIKNVVETVKDEEAQQMLESLETDKMNERKQKIAELTERYKNDPVRLHILSQIASDLNNLD